MNSIGAVRFDPPFIVEAYDNDTTSVLSYEILDGNPDGLFTVDAQTGEIRITKPLEVNSSQVTTEEFMLTLQVSSPRPSINYFTPVMNFDYFIFKVMPIISNNSYRLFIFHRMIKFGGRRVFENSLFIC